MASYLQRFQRNEGSGTREAVQRLEATVATMVTYLFPVVGVTLGVIFLHVVLDARLAIGTGLVLVGIVVVSLRYDQVVSLVTGRRSRQ